MDAWLFLLVKRFFPEVDTMQGRERTYAIAEILGTLYAAPLSLLGLVWLVFITSATPVYAPWPTLVLLLVLLFIFEQLDFFLFVEVTPGTYANWDWSLETIIVWSSVLMFGPGALWLTVLWSLISFVRKWYKAHAPDWRWHLVRQLSLKFATLIFAGLIALAFYKRWGGAIPLPGLDIQYLRPALGAIFVWVVLVALIWIPLLNYFSHSKEFAWTHNPLETLFRFLIITMGWRIFIDPLSVLAAGLYAQNGLGGYMFFIADLLVAGSLAHQLSRALEHSQLRTRELEKLEQLGRALLKTPTDPASLPDILQEHLRNMFPYSHIEVRIFPNEVIVHYPDDWPPVREAIWDWLLKTARSRSFAPGSDLPWGDREMDKAILLVPIVDIERVGRVEDVPIGGIYLARYRNAEGIGKILPAVQSLAAQIATAMYSAKVYTQTLEYNKMEQALLLAGRIQASFLPESLPNIPDWQLAAALYPALETSGDFFDVIPLPDGQLGIVIADVVDKGIGAALYMALSRTLIRTYAAEYDVQPDLVLRAANARILEDTSAGLFVTVFYGILDLEHGTLLYANAGHPPPYLLSQHTPPADTITDEGLDVIDSAHLAPYLIKQESLSARTLRRTGMPLGITADAKWEWCFVQIKPGDMLVLYTDGITEAQNPEGTFFSAERLLGIARENLESSAQELHDTILDTLSAFTGYHLHDTEGRIQADDITLVVVKWAP
ncbi:MAG: PP2C family protein-serine/threonine phosphatase [Anaerolineae bacterium]|nr:PP2C family protein-serine/threonine phosphatase [Anaerolineae bacterium]